MNNHIFQGFNETTVTNICVAMCYITGSFLSLTAAIGLVRFPDTLMRMHAATKPQTLGIILIVCGTAIYHGTSMADTSMLALTVIFTLLTAPASGHRIGQVAYIEQYVPTHIPEDEISVDISSSDSSTSLPHQLPQ